MGILRAEGCSGWFSSSVALGRGMRKVEGWCGGGFGGWVCGWRWVLGWVGLEWSERGEELIPERILLRRLSHVDLVLVTVFYTLGLVSFRVVPKIRYCMSLSPLRQPPKASKSLQHTKTPKPNNPQLPNPFIHY